MCETEDYKTSGKSELGGRRGVGSRTVLSSSQHLLLLTSPFLYLIIFTSTTSFFRFLLPHFPLPLPTYTSNLNFPLWIFTSAHFHSSAYLVLLSTFTSTSHINFPVPFCTSSSATFHLYTFALTISKFPLGLPTSNPTSSSYSNPTSTSTFPAFPWLKKR